MEILKKKKIVMDFSKYEVFEKKDNLTIYKYSKKERKSNRELVYQYFYDEFNINDNDNDNAFIILFFGKIGDGKSTAINAIFNIIKGIELEDNYRFILITKQKTTECNEINYGIHIYYLKDYNNKPVIIINCQGYGSNKGIKYDEMLNEAFKYIYSNVISHINVVCLTSKSNNKFDKLSKSIFSNVTYFFPKEIGENFIILSTFLNKDKMQKEPAFINDITKCSDFINIQKSGMDEKLWFSFDGKCMLDNDKNKLAQYSFSQLNEFYEEKVKKLCPKSTKNYAEIPETRAQITIQKNNFGETFRSLMMEQSNLKEKVSNLKKILKEKEDIEIKRRNYENECKQIKQKIIDLNNELNQKLNPLNYSILEYNQNYETTHCDSCQKNCHDNCDCNLMFTIRCKVFKIFSNECENCGCLKKEYLTDYYHWVKKSGNKNTDNNKLIQEEINRIEKEKKRYNEELNQKNNIKSNFEREINELYLKKPSSYEIKMIMEKNYIEEKIKNIRNQIIYIIIKLQNLSQKIEGIPMNNTHLMAEDEYIDFLLDETGQIVLRDEDQKKELEKIKENLKIFKKVLPPKDDEILKLNDSQIEEILKIIIPNLKTKIKFLELEL